MSTELTVAFVAGLFGLIPFVSQIISTRAQRRDRMTRLNHLRAELELLERLDALQGRVSSGDEAAVGELNLTINKALSKLMGQYDILSEITPSAAVTRKKPSAPQLSFFKRALLLYSPHTISGWMLHTLFYILIIIFVNFYFLAVIGQLLTQGLSGVVDTSITMLFLGLPVGIVLLILQRLARRNALRHAGQLEELNA
jgi:hypothetical protein